MPRSHRAEFAFFIKTLSATRDEHSSLFSLFQYTNWDQIKNGYQNQRAIAEIVGDYFFICPSTHFAQLFADRGMKVYYYFFTQVNDR